MKKEAWVLQLKPEVAKEDFEGEIMFLCDDEAQEFLTNDLQEATIFWDKEKQIQTFKDYEKFMFDRFGPDAICNFGYTNISKNFDWVPVDVEAEE